MTLEERVQDLVAALNGKTFDGEDFEDGNEGYVRKISPLIRSAFRKAILAEREACARLHENVNPASDAERLGNMPGAGAMGAVIEYRDLIRARQD